MPRRRRINEISNQTDRLSTVVRQAKRCRRRGEARKAMLLWREACHLDGESARLWTQYAVACFGFGRDDEARHALSQAVWLRQRARDHRRAKVTGSLVVLFGAGPASLPAA